MDNSISKMFRVWLPTLLLFYAFSASSLKAYRGYHETFGEGDYYLDLYFDVNPMGYFQRGRKENRIAFSGFFVHGEKEEAVVGVFTKDEGSETYQFNSSVGSFEGKLIPGITECEPTLDFRVEGQQRTIASGVLRAGFCR